MKIHELSPSRESRKKKKRLGRGSGSGKGGTSGRGTKGQNAHASKGLPSGFEGGQMPFQRRIPKRGFTNIFKKQYEIINLKDLERFGPGEKIDKEFLQERGMIRKGRKLKLLGKGETSHSLTIKVDSASRKAKGKVESAGGKVETG